MKPFVKWAGGKTSLLDEIQKRLPNYIYSQDFCLIEPFVGGGALSLWALSELPHLKRLIINDYNADLINVYQVIKNNPNDLIEYLKKIQNDYDKLTDLESKKPYFYHKRDVFNQRTSNDIEQAGLFIFLNKSAFNGLYRVNKNNQFNVPIGSYKKPNFVDKENILNISKKLQNTKILSGDFELVLAHLPNNFPCLFYLDPPYRPISDTASFTSYSDNGFDDNEQKRLANFCKKIDKLGHYFLLSNSDPKNTNSSNEFFDELYQDFKIERIQANRAIGASRSSRKKINEIIVSNGFQKMKLVFDEFLNSMSETNATLDYFTDFDKVKNNVAQIGHCNQTISHVKYHSNNLKTGNMNESLAHCPKCQSVHLVKAGFAYGKQRHRCKECNHYFTVMRKSTKKSDDTKHMAIKMYLEGLGFRAIGRLLNISHQTAYRWVRQAGEQHQIKQDTSQTIDIVELDEIHSYSKFKKTTAGLGSPLTETPNKS